VDQCRDGHGSGASIVLDGGEVVTRLTGRHERDAGREVERREFVHERPGGVDWALEDSAGDAAADTGDAIRAVDDQQYRPLSIVTPDPGQGRLVRLPRGGVRRRSA
jgi:hypothetical protein